VDGFCVSLEEELSVIVFILLKSFKYDYVLLTAVYSVADNKARCRSSADIFRALPYFKTDSPQDQLSYHVWWTSNEIGRMFAPSSACSAQASRRPRDHSRSRLRGDNGSQHA
jgi:hypothetical protein